MSEVSTAVVIKIEYSFEVDGYVLWCCFFQSIPSAWTTKHLRSLEKQDVILRTKENTWHTKFYYQKSKNSGGLSSGWKSFALSNDLQEFDVCVFEPGIPVDNAVVLDVNIIRVFHDD